MRDEKAEKRKEGGERVVGRGDERIPSSPSIFCCGSPGTPSVNHSVLSH